MAPRYFASIAISVEYYTDPACPWSWAIEPSIRKLDVELGDELSWSRVMAGLAKEWPAEERGRLIVEWLRVAAETQAPLDPLLWMEGPPASSYPACMAVKAASDQGGRAEERYLRRLREGLLCERLKLDHAEALVEQARVAGLDVERFRIDLRSHAMTEAFAADLAAAHAMAADVPEGERGPHSEATGGVPIPALVFRGDGGQVRRVVGHATYEHYRAAAESVGARPAGGPAPGVEELVERFGRVTTKEVEVVCELPGPRAGAELYRLAEQWKLRPITVLTGVLWEAA